MSDDADRITNARIHDVLLDGYSHLPFAHGGAAEKLIGVYPLASFHATAARLFVRDVLDSLASDPGGICQVLDLGSGFPGWPPYLHDIVETRQPEQARTVYCDNDPIVLGHARAVLDEPAGARVVPWDLEKPGLLDDPGVAGHLDLGEPVAVVLSGVLDCLSDTAAARLLRDLSGLARDSAVIVTTAACADPATARLITLTMDSVAGGRWGQMRTLGQLTALHPALRTLVCQPPVQHGLRTIHPERVKESTGPELMTGIVAPHQL
ncbi:SAM-dependent methyltransferase [Streptomyces sp. NRRL F-525]|uniref:SAM-dependent methyltransferase n=1 Tax=Streptomyces sp. NRRL F-525 TaxID=1463861 RepID=UPI00068F439C|nr:SAM-dependent methyltransferase [Streptomyces sp. NRRL F-525]